MEKSVQEIMEKLEAPLPPESISWRVQSSGIGKNGKPYCRVLAFADSRAVADRLTEIFGPFWKTDVRREGDSYLCTISVRIIHDDGSYEWISRTDGAGIDCDIEPIKSSISSAFKRAAAQFKIGSALWKLGDTFGIVSETGEYFARTKNGIEFRWDPPKIDFEALAKKDDKQSAPLETNKEPVVSSPNTGLKISIVPEETETGGAKESQLSPMEQGQQIVSEIGKIVTSTFKNKPVFGEPEKESLRNIIRSTKTDDCQSLRDLLFSVAEEYENRTGMKAAA